MTPRILLTAFEPYDDEINASLSALDSLRTELPASLTPLADRLAFATLAVDTTTLRNQLTAAVDRWEPDIVILTGQSPGADKIRIERIAVNIRDFSIPDVSGNRAAGDRVSARGPAAYWTTMPGSDDCIARLRAAGIQAERSSHAGTYLCNQGLYEVLELAAERGGGPLAGFVHVPILAEQASRYAADTPCMPLVQLREAIAIIIATVVECGTRC